MSLSRLAALGLFALLLPACSGADKAPDDDSGEVPGDLDGDGFAAPEDCDDGDAAVFPGAEEACNGADDDCDGETDEDPPTWYADADGDGFGDPAAAQAACEAPAGTVADATDCDDADGNVHPGAEDVCDGADNNCDGVTDEDAPTWYADADGDGFGDPAAAQAACEAPAGTVPDGTDCDDTRPVLHPYDLDGDGTTDGCGWRALSSGNYQSCALDSDGLAVCWGRTWGYTAPTVPFTAIEAGADSACGIDLDGAIQCWGRSARTPPTGAFVDLSVGDQYACGIATDGAIRCDGSDANGATEPPDGTWTAISSTKSTYSHTCAVATGGSVACWGWDNAGQTAAPGGSFVDVGAGGAHSCALDGSGAITCWGDDYYGQSSPPSGSFVALEVGLNNNCAIDGAGALHCWGYDVEGVVTTLVPSGTFVAVGLGAEHACALDTAGAIQCWGKDVFGQTTVP